MDDGGDLSWWERRGQWMVVLRPTSAITSFWCVLFQRFWLHMCAFERNFSSSAELNQNLLPTIYRIYLLSSWICQSQSHRVTSCFSASEFHPWPSWASRPPMMAKHRAASLRPPKGTCPSGKMHAYGLQNLKRLWRTRWKNSVALLRAFHEAKCQRRRRRLKRHIHLGRWLESTESTDKNSWTKHRSCIASK